MADDTNTDAGNATETAAADSRAVLIAGKLLSLNSAISGEPVGENAEAHLTSAIGIVLEIFDTLLPIIVQAVVTEYDSMRNVDEEESEKAA